MLKRFFITGTDTSVGKTVVSRALLQALASQGKTVAGYKPVAKGSKETPEGLRNKDALVLQSVSTIELPYEAVNPIALSEEEGSPSLQRLRHKPAVGLSLHLFPVPRYGQFPPACWNKFQSYRKAF